MAGAIKTFAVSMIAAALATLIKKDSPVFSLLLVIATAVYVMWSAAEPLREITDELLLLSDGAGISPAVVSAVFKCVALGIITRLASDILRDSGMGAAASSAELFGAAAALWCTLPLVREVMEIVRQTL